MEEITLYLGGSTILATLLVGLLKKYIKDFIMPRWGDFGVLAVLLVIAFILSMLGYGWGFLPSDITGAIGTIFAGAIVIYQVLYKAIFQKVVLGNLDDGDKTE